MLKNPLYALRVKAMDVSRDKYGCQLDKRTGSCDIDVSCNTFLIINSFDRMWMRPNNVAFSNWLISLKKSDQVAILLHLKGYQRKANRAKTVKGVINLPNRLHLQMKLLDIPSGTPVAECRAGRNE
jgi:hypothetical protein